MNHYKEKRRLAMKRESNFRFDSNTTKLNTYTDDNNNDNNNYKYNNKTRQVGPLSQAIRAAKI